MFLISFKFYLLKIFYPGGESFLKFTPGFLRSRVELGEFLILPH